MRGVVTGALLVLLVAVPPTSAQALPAGELTVSVEGLSDRPIPPLLENRAFEVLLTLACSEGERVAAVTQGQVVVMVEFDAPPGVEFTGARPAVLDTVPCLQPGTTTVTNRTQFQVTIDRAAPALQALGVVVTAVVEPRQAPAETPASAAATFQVTSDYYSQSQVDLATKLEQCVDGQATYDLEVLNLGNARTQYTFDLGSRPPGDEWDITLPGTVVLDRPQSTDAPSSTALAITVACPDGNKEGSFQVIVKPAAFDDPSKTGNPLAQNLLARARPLDGALDAPAPGPWLALALLGLALLARRRA